MELGGLTATSRTPSVERGPPGASTLVDFCVHLRPQAAVVCVCAGVSGMRGGAGEPAERQSHQDPHSHSYLSVHGALEHSHGLSETRTCECTGTGEKDWKKIF